MPEVTQLLSDGGELGPLTHPLSLTRLLAGCHAPESMPVRGFLPCGDGGRMYVKLRCPSLSREKLLKEDDSAAATSPLCLGLSGGELPNQLTGGIVRMFNGHGFLRLQLLSHAPVHTHSCTHKENHLCP